jgi:hypothetical protein
VFVLNAAGSCNIGIHVDKCSKVEDFSSEWEFSRLWNGTRPLVKEGGIDNDKVTSELRFCTRIVH